MQAAASLAVLLGLAVLDWGPRAQAGFVSASAMVSSHLPADGRDFILGQGTSSAAADVPSSPAFTWRLLPHDFQPASPYGGAGSPSSGPSGGSSISPYALAAQTRANGREPSLAGYLRAPQVRHFPDPSLSCIFRPPRSV
jgi:hypothetical protein